MCDSPGIVLKYIQIQHSTGIVAYNMDQFLTSLAVYVNAVVPHS